MTTATPERQETAIDIFQRVLVGVDDTPHAFEAARQAAVLRTPGGTLHLVAAVDSGKAVHAGFAAAAVADQMRYSAQEALDAAAAATGPTTQTLIEGRPCPTLLERLRRHDATLLALGAHGHRRGAGRLLGAAGSILLREVPSSVLLARPDSWPAGHPERIVAGVDGSPQSALAADVARALSKRFGARLTFVAGLGGKLRDPEGVKELFPEAVIDERSPVDALVSASRSADLVVLGSRGLHGLQALGSVSERVAHRAHSSVLVVRDQATSGR
ncbi:MAG TPA: universal stress protein [Gaiellaceae bacterium]|nr:universal stress protein [Gaiellaceae bacterium]